MLSSVVTDLNHLKLSLSFQQFSYKAGKAMLYVSSFILYHTFRNEINFSMIIGL